MTDHLTTNDPSTEELEAFLRGLVEQTLAGQAPVEWKTREEAAEYLRMDVRTLDRYVREGHLTKYNPAGMRAPRFKRTDLDALMIPEGR